MFKLRNTRCPLCGSNCAVRKKKPTFRCRNDRCGYEFDVNG